MSITRRAILKSTAALTATSALQMSLGLNVWANTSMSLGQKKVDVLSDGHLRLPANFLFSDLAVTDINPILQRYGLPTDTLEPDCNLTLIRDGERTILFDVGSGPNFMPSAGKLSEAMEAIDLDPADVTHVVFTHAHPDHLWGLLDEFDDPLFPEAQHMISKMEWDYWIDPKTVDTIGTQRQAFAAGAKRLLSAMEDRMEFFRFDEEILPGILARSSVGHTPGHAAFEVRDGSESLMVVGDAIANHHVAFEKPDWLSGSDQDKELGAKTRASLLDQIASQNMQMIGFHLPYPGIGRAERTTENGYRFIAA